MRETDVIVTTVKHTTSVRLPVGVMVDMSCVAAEGVSMLWCPPSDSKSEGKSDAFHAFGGAVAHGDGG